MKIQFLIDSTIEAKNIPLVVGLGGYDVLTKQAFKRFDGKTKKGLYPEVAQMHKEQKEKLKKKKLSIQKYWKNVENNYIFEMEKIMEHKLKQNRTCYITSSLSEGIADVIKRKNIFLGIKLSSDKLNYTLMHELTHLHHADLFIKLNLTSQITAPLNEAMNHLTLFKSPIQKLLPASIKYNNRMFVKKNPKFMKEMEKLWEKRKSFESFLKQAIKLNKKTKGVIIC